MSWRTPFARRALLLCGIPMCLLLTAQATLAAPGSRLLWASRYDGPAHLDDTANAMAVSPDGSKVFVTGYRTASNGSTDYATVAYDATGTQSWVKGYDGPGHTYDFAYALGVSPDGSTSTVFVTGIVSGSNGSKDYRTVAYSTA